MFTSLLKTTGLLNLNSKAFMANNNEIVNIDSCRANETVVNLFKNNKSRNLTYVLNIEATRKPIFQTSNIKKVFNYLKQVFIKASIF